VAYSPAMDQAIRFAIAAHAGQERKGQAGVPYLVHPIHVGMLLLRHEFAETVVIGGLLHDVLEDTRVTRDELKSEFGEEVLGYLLEVSEDKSRPWVERKRHTIDSIVRMSRGALAITAADKVHNVGDIARLEDERGERAWQVFTKPREMTLDYYRSVARELEAHFPHPLTTELLRLLARWDP